MRMRWIFLFIFFCFICANGAAAQSDFSFAKAPDTARDAIYVPITDDQQLRAELHVRARNMEEFDQIVLPLNANAVVIDRSTWTYHLRRDDTVHFSYIVTPQIARQNIATLTVLPNKIDFQNTDGFTHEENTPGLTIKSNGLRHHIVWNLNFSRPNPAGNVSPRLPDIIAVGLPEDYEGRTINKTASMVFPTPIDDSNPFLFASGDLQDGRIELAYDDPEPPQFAWFQKHAYKFVGIALPILLLPFTQGDKVNRRRYLIVFWVLAGAIILLYGGLILYAIQLGASLNDLIVDISALIVTGLVAGVSYWILTKDEPKTAPPPVV